MTKLKGEGRTRFGRFAAISVPATIAAAGMGVAIVQGMVSATLTSADGFQLDSAKLQAGALAMGGNAVETASGNTKAVFADVDNAHLDGMCVGATQAFSSNSVITAMTGVTGIGLAIVSDDSDVVLKHVGMNAAALATGDSTMGNTNIGIQAGDADSLEATGGKASLDSTGVASDAFALTANDQFAGYYANGTRTIDPGATSAASDDTLDASTPAVASNAANAEFVSSNALGDLDATSYSITLNGLALASMKVSPSLLHAADTTIDPDTGRPAVDLCN